MPRNEKLGKPCRRQAPRGEARTRYTQVACGLCPPISETPLARLGERSAVADAREAAAGLVWRPALDRSC